MSNARNAQSTLNLTLLGLTYLFYFGQLGVFVPYLGVFLDGRGFSSEQIGKLFALITIARIIGPNLWSSMADRSGKGLRILQVGSFLTLISFSLVFFVTGFWGLTLGFALMMMFWTAILPQLEVIALNVTNNEARRYSRIRLWGSIGFIILTMLTGKAIDLFDTEAPVVISAIVLLALFISSLVLAEKAPVLNKQEEKGSVWKLINTRVFWVFITSSLLLQISFGTYYSFFALYLRDLGYSGQATGAFIALGVAAEIVIFLLAGRLIDYFGVKWILFISILLTAIRWYFLGTFPQFMSIIIVSQLLHAFSFAMTHAASVNFIHRYFGKSFQSRGQAIYISVGFGLGGAIGNYVAGQLWMQGTGAYQSFLFCTVAAFLAAISLLMVKSSKL